VQKVKPSLLRGFDQEYLPQDQLHFNRLIDIIRRNFELYGFLPIETPSAERREVLTSKGGVEKEIYALTRLAEADDDEAATKGALRFDLTVPLARYVAMRERELAFPFRRYQIQRVWRGETPQAKKGRWREFYQCDIDIIGRDKLSYLAEAEIPSVIYSVFKEMAIGEFRIRINNRKVLRGLLQEFGVAEDKAAAVLRILDKAEKEDAARIRADLEREGVSSAGKLLELIAARRTTDGTLAALAEVKNETLQKGLDELRSIVTAIRQFGVPDSAFAWCAGWTTTPARFTRPRS
jgi:histidyl-tRNA synthetase